MILSLIYALHVLIGKYLLNLSGIQLVSLTITCFKRYRYGGTIWVYCGITDNVPSWSMGYIGVKQRDRKRERKERDRERKI